MLPGPVKGQFFYLYMVMDVWSRRILGVEIHDRECGELAKGFFRVPRKIIKALDSGMISSMIG